jgi:poly(3-hydroxybutyrate) depolymerase
VPALCRHLPDVADKNPARPRTLTMMGGPIDTREAPTAVNTTATERPFSWFEQNVIATVPAHHPGAGARSIRASSSSPASWR